MRNVVITGGSRGIGAACAEVFRKNGDRVIIIYEKNDSCAKNIADKYNAVLYKADVASREAIFAVAEEISAVYGKVDVLINNAGMSQIKLFSDITEEDYKRMMGVNIDGAFFAAQAFLPGMIHDKSGKIINISSMWGEVGASCEVHYSTSKAAMIGFTKALAKELAPSGICVNCITPGVIDTEMNSELSAEDKDALIDEIPLTRMGKAEEVAKLALFLASDDASYITGQVIGVNGGMVI